jgi:orotidine-5'-phosphate decarboxylase
LVHFFNVSQVPRRLSDLEQISAGAMGGALSGLICGPTELLMIHQQRSGLSLIATPGNIVGISGVTGEDIRLPGIPRGHAMKLT